MSIYVDTKPAWWRQDGERRVSEWWSDDAKRMEEAHACGPVSPGTVVDDVQFDVNEDLQFVCGRDFETLAAGERVPWMIPDADDMAYLKKCFEHGHPRTTVEWKGRKRFVPTDRLTRAYERRS